MVNGLRSQGGFPSDGESGPNGEGLRSSCALGRFRQLGEDCRDLRRAEDQESPLSATLDAGPDDVATGCRDLGHRGEVATLDGPFRETAQDGQLLLQGFARDDPEPGGFAVLDPHGRESIDGLKRGYEVRAHVGVTVELERVGADRRFDVGQPFGRDLIERTIGDSGSNSVRRAPAGYYLQLNAWPRRLWLIRC